MIAWVLVLWGCGTPAPPPATAPVVPAELSHVGSAACAGCHPQTTAAWKTSDHALAEQVPDPVAHAALGVPPVVALPDREGPVSVVRVLGHDPIWQPLVHTTGGRVQAASVVYEPATGSWHDLFDDHRDPGDWGHWTGGGNTWNSRCAHCHDTAVEAGWHLAGDRYDTTLAEVGVGCEACHGPGSRHAADPSVALPAGTDRAAVQATCEPCHTRGEVLTQPWSPVASTLDQVLPALPGLAGDWGPAGEVTTESFEAVAFRHSAMWAAGVRCVDCHEPHSGDLKAEGDALCVGCHAGLARHDRHPSDAVPTCVDCHMPVTTFMQVDRRHDHGFSIPSPVLEAAHGVPSACAGACHDAASVAELAAAWPVPEARAARGAALLAARAGDPAAALARAAVEDHPVWRASLLAALAPWPEAAGGLAREAATSDDPWLRRAAAEVLDPRVDADMLVALRGDTVRAVRLQAARRLRAHAPPSAPEQSELRDHLERFGDAPGAAVELGAWWALFDQPATGVPHLRRAVALDPRDPGAVHNLAVALARVGAPSEAVAVLEAAVTRMPEACALWSTLALARAGDGGGGVQEALRRALACDPSDARARYNLALDLAATDPAASLAELRRAAADGSDDPDIRAALAQRLLADGDRAGARTEAEAALGAAPGHPLARWVMHELR